ncbi:hypothetical protein [Streptomyces venetus]|uniref:hypothetical protein n=1 Tax=Streptomyces venetus TaxID=1701086 RepID=UPI003C3076B2
MTWPAALPGAALRMLRTAAGRRALQVVLLVGGVLVIGLLCGERASAADGVRGLTDSAARRVVSDQRSPARPEAHAQVDRRGPSDVRPVSERGGSGHRPGAVGQRVVRVVAEAGDAGEAVSRGLGEAPTKEPSSPSPSQLPKPPTHPAPSGPPALSDPPVLPKLPTLSDPPGLPKLPVLPDPSALPDPPSLPKLPSLVELPALPGLLPAPPTAEAPLPGESPLPGRPDRPAVPLPGPVTYDPAPGRVATPSADAPASADPATAAEAADAGTEAMAHGDVHRPAGGAHRVHPAHPVHLVHFAAPDRRAHDAAPPAHPSAAHVAHAPGAPGHPDRPDGMLGNRATVDNGTPRHGDAHAVTLSLRVPLRLVPDAVARSLAAGTRDSHRDVPLFPG